MFPVSANLAGAVSQETLPDLSLLFEQQKELLHLQMQLEKEKELALERVRQQAALDKALALEKLRQQIDFSFSTLIKLDLESKRLILINDGKLCEISRRDVWAQGSDGACDILSSLHLVPKFNEKEVTFFA